MAGVIIYQDKPDNWHYDAPTQEIRNYGCAIEKIVYVDGVLCALDHEGGASVVIISVSRWELAGI
jgi:hypothetical protein